MLVILRGIPRHPGWGEDLRRDERDRIDLENTLLEDQIVVYVDCQDDGLQLERSRQRSCVEQGDQRDAKD